MTNRKLRKAIVVALGASALAAVSTQASATGFGIGSNGGHQITVGSTTGATDSGGVYVWDGSNIGYGDNGGAVNQNDPTPYGAGQARVAGSNPMGVSTVAESANLGWNHNMHWYTFQITKAGGYTVAVNRTTPSTSYQPAFSLYSSGNAEWDALGTSHSFNQVVGPNGSNLNSLGNATGNPSAWCVNGAPCYMQTGNGHDVTGFVGYANSGPGFTNNEGSQVTGALTFGHSAKGALKNPALAYNASTNPYTSVVTKGSYVNAHAGSIEAAYAGAGSSVNTSNPFLTNANGGGHVDLQLWLPAGWYVIGAGGSCADFTCTPTAAASGAFNITVLDNANVSAPVPVPAAIWLLGSALAGMGVIGRRKDTAKA